MDINGFLHSVLPNAEWYEFIWVAMFLYGLYYSGKVWYRVQDELNYIARNWHMLVNVHYSQRELEDMVIVDQDQRTQEILSFLKILLFAIVGIIYIVFVPPGVRESVIFAQRLTGGAFMVAAILINIGSRKRWTSRHKFETRKLRVKMPAPPDPPGAHSMESPVYRNAYQQAVIDDQRWSVVLQRLDDLDRRVGAAEPVEGMKPVNITLDPAPAVRISPRPSNEEEQI